MKRSLLFGAALAASAYVADGVAFPRVWTSASGINAPAVFEEAVKDCVAHGVDVIGSRARDEKTCAEQLAVCRKYGIKLQIGVDDACKSDPQAKNTGRYELAVMSGGCYKGLAIDRNLFSFSAGRHEIILEPPVYSRGQAYAKHPHYYMLGDGHYFGGYVPTGRAEIVVPERLFDGRQHLRIIPAKVEAAPPGVEPENDSAAQFRDAREIRERRLVKLSFDLTGCAGCRLDKVGIAVYWRMDDKSPGWRPDRTCYSVFSPITRERMRDNVRGILGVWARANGGSFPSDAVVGLRLGDEIFNATGWLDCAAASFPLWDFSDSAVAAFRAASPAGVEVPRTWGAPEVYGPDACAQFLYLFHRACAEYLRPAVKEAHSASPGLMTFRNTTRGDAWSYGNDHDGTGQELLAQVLDMIHLDPYPVGRWGYAKQSIPADMAYMSGFARRFGKPLIPWMQAHEFPSGGLVNPTPEDVAQMWGQMRPFAPDAIMWLGYNPASGGCTFPIGNPATWEKAKGVHADMKAMPHPKRSRPSLAVVRPYSARAVVCDTGNGTVHPADAILREFTRAWSCDLGQQYDVFEVPPYETKEARARRNAVLKRYAHVVSSVDWPGATNVACGCAGKVLSRNDLARMRAEFRREQSRWADTYDRLKREAVNRQRLIIWDDDGCDMTHYPYKRPDLVKQPASVRNFELVFLEATENTKADVIGYSGTMGFGYFTALRTGGYVNTNCFAEGSEPWRNAVNEFAAMGKDAMDLATDFARRNGKEIFLSLRFNDNHDNGHPAIMLSPFKKDNPEIMVGHGRKVRCCGPNAADFAQEKVREFVKKYMRGYMENYDLDGIEFDFFRHPQLFRTVAMGGHATAEELATMTQLMKDFRAMAEEVGRKRGRPFVLCARVPDSFDYCRAIGIDLDAWLKAGALDFLVVGGYFQLEPWRKTAKRVHGYGIKCYASLDETRIDQMVRRQKGRMLPGRNDKECWIARIAAAMASGMDGVNLFNIEYFKHDDQRYIMSHDIRDLDGIDKTYFGTYVGGGGYMPQNFLVGGMDFLKATGVNPAYPKKLGKGACHAFELVFGDDLAAAKRKGKTAKVEVRVLTDLNGAALPKVKVRGKALSGASQKDGIATFAADANTFVKGTNMVEIAAPEDMTLYDFSVRVTFQ